MEEEGKGEAQRVSGTRPDSVGHVFALFAPSTWQPHYTSKVLLTFAVCLNRCN
jgi:hypothetical protein